jgi:hypothetical protein
MWQRAFVFEDLSNITTIDPSAARRTPHKMLALILRRSAETPSNVFAPRDHHFIGQAVTIRRLRSYVVDATRCFGKSG